MNIATTLSAFLLVSCGTFGPGVHQADDSSFSATVDGLFIATDGNVVLTGGGRAPTSRRALGPDRTFYFESVYDSTGTIQSTNVTTLPHQKSEQLLHDSEGSYTLLETTGGVTTPIRTSIVPAVERIEIQKTRPDGQILWTRTLYEYPDGSPPIGLILDHSSNVICVGSTVRKLSPSGDELWAIPLAETLSVRAAAAGLDDAIYLIAEDGKFSDGSAVKLNRDGQELWRASFVTDGFDRLSHVTVDSNGHPIVAGVSTGTFYQQPYNPYSDVFLAKLDKDDGAFLFLRQGCHCQEGFPADF